MYLTLVWYTSVILPVSLGAKGNNIGISATICKHATHQARSVHAAEQLGPSLKCYAAAVSPDGH